MDVIRRIILADGTILSESECGYADKNLWCYLKNLTFAEAFQIFSNPEKVRSIIFEYGLEHRYHRTTYVGFTDVQVISKREFTIDVNMTGMETSITEEDIVKDTEEVIT